MHEHAEVLIKHADHVEEQIKAIMEPYREIYFDDEDSEPQGWWDFYQIGGRWKGEHDPEYSQTKDPLHWETCWLCAGTGKRTDMVVSDGCNGCGGTGVKLKWPTQWGSHHSDIIPVEKVTPKLTCARLILPGIDMLTSDDWNNGLNVKDALDKHNIISGYLVTVDYHD